MSLRRLSPVAELLRNSRLFALPHALPIPAKPSIKVTNTSGGASVSFDSETATLPYPTHPAIETTEESLARGDWGLKRPLPLRSTARTSTPTIKIDNLDSIDNITDFSSASDHVRTLEKWQEIDMPISVMSRERRASGYVTPPRSVFESDLDKTVVHQNIRQQRWKFRGPWLAGQSHGEFTEYLERKVKKRKAEFREFLRQRLIRSQVAVMRQEMLEMDQETQQNPESQQNEPVEVTEEELDMFIKRLRKNQNVMYGLIEEFLDLPKDRSERDRAVYNDDGPPTMHPSAGLSYLRTASHTFNHPLNGPQEDKSPMPGRVLKPQVMMDRTKNRAMVGIAGVAAEDPKLPFTRSDDLPEMVRINPDISGGAKVWVQPKRAEINTKGLVKLGFTRAAANAVAVLKADRGEDPNNELPAAAVEAATSRDVPDLAPSRLGAARKGPLGYGLEDVATSPRAKPFGGASDISELLSKTLQGGGKKW